MDKHMSSYLSIIKDIEYIQGIQALKITENNEEEIYIDVSQKDFSKVCFGLHQRLSSPVEMLFACDQRREKGIFAIYCVFLGVEHRKWFLVRLELPENSPKFNSLAKEIYSANLFEREIKEMFGIEPLDNPDSRRLNLHDEVWPEGKFPLRKDFLPPEQESAQMGEYKFSQIEGEGVFEIPVGPVHAGIIGPGHFRFSVAGEPIINLEIRLGFTHRGVEKLFEGKVTNEAVKISESIAGDSAFAYSLAYTQAIEKICKVKVPEYASILRGICLELERMYNHVSGIGGIALDVGYSFPAMYASIIKENILCLNEKITGSRYLKNLNKVGGVNKSIDEADKESILKALGSIKKDFDALKTMIFSSMSFMDRVDTTGILMKKTAEDLGITGLAARASGINKDFRKIFPGVYNSINFNSFKQEGCDVLARLNIRMDEFEESLNIIRQFMLKLAQLPKILSNEVNFLEGYAIGSAEAWRGRVLFWVNIDNQGVIQRCKIVDTSFHNWQGLSFAVLGNIVPDFPVCNKSFDLSYPGNDL